MKPIISFLMLLLTTGAMAGDEFWLKGKTDDSHEIVVYRSESCGCCKAWIDHLEEHHFDVTDIRVKDMDAYKQNLGVPPRAASCHTAVIDGLVIEGHVPAQDIKRLLSNRDNTRLLTVPAMPSGTPGMDTPGAPKQDFKVFAISDNNEVSIYNSYSGY